MSPYKDLGQKLKSTYKYEMQKFKRVKREIIPRRGPRMQFRIKLHASSLICRYLCLLFCCLFFKEAPLPAALGNFSQVTVALTTVVIGVPENQGSFGSSYIGPLVQIL